MLGNAVAMTELSTFCKNSGLATTRGTILLRKAMPGLCRASCPGLGGPFQYLKIWTQMSLQGSGPCRVRC